jgi:FkbM family methyltransferase
MKPIKPISYRDGTWDQQIFHTASTRGLDYDVDVTGKVVIDVGAHIGGFTAYAAENGAVSVHSFEVYERNYYHLVRNVGKYSNVITYNKAVFPTDYIRINGEPIEFDFEPPASSVNTGGGNVVMTSTKPNVSFEMVSLDWIVEPIKEYPIVLKLDCESSEFPILFGATHSTLKRIDRIVGEFHNPFPNSRMDKFCREHLSVNTDTYPVNMEGLKLFLHDHGFDVTIKNVHPTNEIDLTKPAILGIFEARRI